MQRLISAATLVFTGLVVFAAVPNASAQGACDRACLTGFLDGWFKGLVNNSASGVPVFLGRNLWDRRYPVVDEERGIVLSMVRFGLKDGQKSQATATANSRIVAEFFTVKRGLIQEVQAVLFNVPDNLPTQWPADYGPGRGGAGW